MQKDALMHREVLFMYLHAKEYSYNMYNKIHI